MMDAVRILLERMDTNPEEFTRDGPWAGIITIYKDLIPEDEIELLDTKLNEIRTKQFTAAVIEQLMKDKKQSVVIDTQRLEATIKALQQRDEYPTDHLVFKTKNRYILG
jgi:hypothetical protein